jgi:site-specific DNA-methyltransferase (adenine-specific)
MLFHNQVWLGDCRELLKRLPEHSIAACITDPPYNYEFIGHQWDAEEITRRTERVKSSQSKTLVKNIPYGSGLAGGVRNPRWYERVRQNIVEYEQWCFEWGQEVFRVAKPGAVVAVFNSTRTMAHVQVALERAGFYARDCVVYRRHSGIPKGFNLSAKLQQSDPQAARAAEGWHSCLRNEWEAIVILQKPLEGNYLTTYQRYGTGLFYTANPDGSFQSNILENIPRDDKDTEEGLKVHCTVKPLALMEKLVTMFAPHDPQQIVLDPFAGSGTTLVAAKRIGMGYLGMEIEADYVPIIEQRLAKASLITPSDEALHKLPLFRSDRP